jgi:hypothetical protein
MVNGSHLSVSVGSVVNENDRIQVTLKAATKAPQDPKRRNIEIKRNNDDKLQSSEFNLLTVSCFSFVGRACSGAW